MSFLKIGKTMTPKEYLDNKEQQELDELFDNAIREAHQKQLEELSKKEHEDYIIGLITKLGDYEAELNIMEERHKTTFNNSEVTQQEKDEINKYLKVLKQKYTKTKNELDRVIKEENEIKNNGK